MNSPSIRIASTMVALFFISLFFTSDAHSANNEIGLRKWTKIEIPGATCGKGHSYVVWLELRDTKKLAAEFMGGGACWSAKTCFGTKLRAWMFPLPQLPVMSSLSVANEKLSPFWNHSMIYFPYCTGDVHAGNHVTTYKGKKVYHTGHKNVQMALEYLKKQELVRFDELEELALFGSSAGAIGAIAHTGTFDKFVPLTTQRVLIADAPGLHFGKTFWNKFTDNIIADFKIAFAHLGFDFSRNDHVMAKYLPQVCESLKHWRVGILQGSKDIVMSQVFGEISPKEHEKLVYGPYGAYQLAQKTSNCSAWTPSTFQHTFMIVRNPVGTTAGAMSAIEFIQEVNLGNMDGLSFK